MLDYKVEIIKNLVDGLKTWSQLERGTVPKASLYRIIRSLEKEGHVRKMGRVYGLVSVPRGLLRQVLKGYGPFRCPICGQELISLSGTEIGGGDLVGCRKCSSLYLIRCPICGYPMKVAKTHTLEIRRPFWEDGRTITLSYDIIDAFACPRDRFKWKSGKSDKWPKAFEIRVDRKKSPADPIPRRIRGLDFCFFLFIHRLSKREGKAIISQRLEAAPLSRIIIEVPTPFDSPEFQTLVSVLTAKSDPLSAKMTLTMLSDILAMAIIRVPGIKLDNPYSENGQKMLKLANILFLKSYIEKLSQDIEDQVFRSSSSFLL
jgi:DNA-directed RNA polymerase subunit RPC12/RpoP